MFDMFKKKPVKQEEPLETKSIMSQGQFFGLTSPTVSNSMYASALTACLSWLQRNIKEANVAVYQTKDDAQVYAAVPYQIENLAPGDNLTFKDKISGIASDLVIHGNSCLIKLFNSKKQVIAFQYIPWNSVTVNLTQSNNAIESYTISGKIYYQKDIIHFRQGVSPLNPFLGLGVLQALKLHNDADYASALYTSGLIGSPAQSMILVSKQKMTQEQCDTLERLVHEKATITKSGSAIVISGDYEKITDGYTPEELNISSLIEYTESRICALTGIPPQVVGLSVGNNPTYSNYSEAQKAVTNNLLVPMLVNIADSFTRQAPEIFKENESLTFKYEEIQALQADFNSESKRVGDLYKNGVISRGEAKSMLGFTAVPRDYDVYYTGGVN